jgi:hypothetical protein
VLARLDGQDVAGFDVTIEAAATRGVRLEVTEKQRFGTAAETKLVSALLRSPDAVVAWFDSGHTLSGGELFATRHRDIRFRNWRWARLADSVVGEEKPLVDSDTKRRNGKPVRVFVPDNVGVGTPVSLFDWVAQGGQPDVLETGSGWLVCDDGSLEVADFVHLDTRGSIPILQLIHAKGASSSSPGRKIKVTDYEVVVAQAEKNLRWLDPKHLAARLRKKPDAAIGRLLWKDGVRVAAERLKKEREAFLKALEDIRRVERRVVVLQPSMRKRQHDKSVEDFEKANPGNPSSDLIRVFHLDHLLLNLELGCMAYGSDVLVVGHDDEP